MADQYVHNQIQTFKLLLLLTAAEQETPWNKVEFYSKQSLRVITKNKVQTTVSFFIDLALNIEDENTKFTLLQTSLHENRNLSFIFSGSFGNSANMYTFATCNSGSFSKYAA